MSLADHKFAIMPFVNARMLPDFVGKAVRIVGRIPSSVLHTLSLSPILQNYDDDDPVLRIQTNDDDSNSIVTVLRRTSSLPKYDPLNPIPKQVFDKGNVLMVAGIVQEDLRVMEISVERVECGSTKVLMH